MISSILLTSDYAIFVIKIVQMYLISFNAHFYFIKIPYWLFMTNILTYQLSIFLVDKPIITKIDKKQYFLLYYLVIKSLFLLFIGN